MQSLVGRAFEVLHLSLVKILREKASSKFKFKSIDRGGSSNWLW